MAGLPAFAPATAAAVLALLDYYQVELSGRHAVVVGRSVVVGKPVAHLLLDRNATVTICHSRTADLPAITRQADVLVVAAGRAGLIGPGHVSPGTTVIDVGTNAIAGGGLAGDVDPAVAGVAAALTPVPGGVGPVTTALLLRHVVEAAGRRGMRPALGLGHGRQWVRAGPWGSAGRAPWAPRPVAGSICSGPPPLVTTIEECAAGLVAIPTSWGPPSLSVVSA